MHLKPWKQNVRFMHKLSIPRFSCIHSDILRKKPNTGRTKWSRQLLLFPICAGRRLPPLLNFSKHALWCIITALQIKRDAGCLVWQATAPKQDCTSLWSQATEKETMNTYVQATYLCFDCLACGLCRSSSSVSTSRLIHWQKPLPIKGNEHSLRSSSRVLCDVCTYRRACLRAALAVFKGWSYFMINSTVAWHSERPNCTMEQER